VVGSKTFEPTDSHGLFFHLQVYALAFALTLLRANATANSGKCTCEFQNASSAVNVATLHIFNKSWDVDVNRATLHATGLRAVEAAASFTHSFIAVKALANFFVASDTVSWVKFVHRGASNSSAFFSGHCVAQLDAPIGVARSYIFNLFVSHNRE
jgi:hypothetical protein